MRRKVTSVGARPAMRLATWAGFGANIAEAPGDGATVSQLMRKDVRGARETVSAESLAAFLLERRLPGLPVIDGEGRLSGLVTHADLVRERALRGDIEEVPLRAHSRGYSYELGAGFHADRTGQATLGELMRLDVTAVLPSTPLWRAGELFSVEEVELLPVIDPNGEVIGVLFAIDLLRWLCRPGGSLPPGPPRPVQPAT